MHVSGVVQGVGFRPFVWRLATREQLGGWVHNDASGVHIEVQGDPAAVGRFLGALRDEAPPLSRVDTVVVEDRELVVVEDSGFAVRASSAGVGRAEIPPDVATCADCLAELADPSNRRFRHPFVNCTACGPRYSIVRDLPYDRAATTMSGFALCPACRREYEDPADRRFHAEPICCPACGPQLVLVDADGRVVAGPVIADRVVAADRVMTSPTSTPEGDDPIEGAAALLRAGAIVAVKGIGGYHLAVRAADESAVARLRARKHREDKPFAVLVANLAAARALCDVDDAEAAALCGPEAPIVLLHRRPDAPVAGSVAPGRGELGLLLPASGLHHLLVGAVGEPIVLTSGNRSDEPMAIDDDDARRRLGGIADALLTHDRPIWRRADDSIVRRFAPGLTMLRRARGYAPAPLRLPVATPIPLLAVGAELKSTVCLAVGDRAYLSPHLGDLEHLDALTAFRDATRDLCRLVGVEPELIVHDLHPEYLSTKHAMTLDLPLLGVQHHHAHFAGCLADHGRAGAALGVIFDGIGYGSDGTLWGGEVLVGDLTSAQRVGGLPAVPMPGGVAAIREPWRMAVAYLGDRDVTDLGLHRAHAVQWASVAAVAHREDLSPRTSSMGRLFDAVAALCGLGETITHEGQAAQRLEQAATRSTDGAAYRFGPGLDPAPVVDAVIDDLRRGRAVADIARRFHRGLADAVRSAARAETERRQLDTVVLSGGVFQNAVLVGDCLDALASSGLHVLTSRRVPPNDGAISFGQVAVAAARCAREPSTAAHR